MNSAEPKIDIQNLVQKLQGTRFTCWGLAEGPSETGANQLYYGTIAKVDEQNPLKMRIDDGNVIELQLNAFGKGDHLVTLDEPAKEGEGNKANFVCFVTVGYNVQEAEPVFLLDYMRQLANP